MKYADIVSTSLNKAQAASNQLVNGQIDKSNETLRSLADFLVNVYEDPKEEVKEDKADAETSADTKAAGGQDEVKDSKEPPGGSHDSQAAETTEAEKESTAEQTDEALR